MRLGSMGLMLGGGSIIDEGCPCVYVCVCWLGLGVWGFLRRYGRMCGKGRKGVSKYRYRPEEWIFEVYTKFVTLRCSGELKKYC